MKFSHKLHTNGKGYWSDEARSVRTKSVELDSYHNGYGDIRVYFNKQDWNVSKHGFIYTDPLFLKELREALVANGFSSVKTVEYSEQGLQGKNYVHLQVGRKFLSEFFARVK